MRFVRLLPAAVLFVAAFLPVRAVAQTATATLLVDVRASDGSRLPGVEMRLTNVTTGVERVLTTDEGGSAAASLLPAGEYNVMATVRGYAPQALSLRLEPGAKRVLDVQLRPSAFRETVTVQGSASAARPASGTVADIFDGRVLVMTPVQERDFVQFTQQAPGAVPPAPGSRLSTQANAGVNVSGAREAANNFLLDGLDNNDQFLNRIVVTPSLEAVQQFTLLQNTYDAEYGRNAGAQVNVVLKSGGSILHGSLFEYFRDETLDARGAFDPADEPKPPFSRHQFGGTVGGPVARSRMFYFASAEGLRTRSAHTRLAQVPTREQRSGDFAESPGVIVDPLTGQPFPGNRIPHARLDGAGSRVAALYPDPNRAGQPNLVSSPASSRDALQLTVKLDRVGPDTAPVALRYSLTADDRAEPFPARGRNMPGFGTTVVDVGQHVAGSLSQLVGDGFFNELRAGWNRLRRENVAVSKGRDLFGELGFVGPNLAPVDRGYPAFTLAGYETLGDDPNLPVVRRAQTLHISDALTMHRGRHQLKTGGELRHYRSDGFNHLFARGQVVFTGAFTGDALADLLLGLPSFSFIAANDNRQALRTTSWNAFVQHDWNVRPGLTINGGLRYEFNAAPVDGSDRMRIFDLAELRLRTVGEDGVPRSGVHSDRNNFAPRLGVAWRMSDSHEAMLRGGVGVYYDAGTLIENSALYFNPPFFDLETFFPADELLHLSDPFPSGRGFRPLPSVNTLDPHFRTARTTQGSLAIEDRWADVNVAARYVTSRGRNLPRRRNINQPVPGEGPLDDRRSFQNFADILLVESAATSSYEALQLKIDRQRVEGLSVRASYTLGRSMDDASAFLQSEGNDNTPQDARRPEAEWGPSDFDVRHRLSLAAIFSVPHAVQRPWLRDWHVSALVTVQSGYPFTPRVGFDNSNTGNVGGAFGFDRPNEVHPADAPSGAVFYDGRAFAISSPYTFGNAGRNIVRGPGFASLDMALMRGFQLGDRRLEGRLEIYNVLNRTNLGLPDSFVDRPTFGQSLSARPPREVQLAIRFAF